MGRSHAKKSDDKTTSSTNNARAEHSLMKKLHYDYKDPKAMQKLRSALRHPPNDGASDAEQDDDGLDRDDGSYEDDADSAAEALPLDVRAAPGTATLERRRMQNRLAQQRMRKRKENKMDELQAELDQQDKMMTELRAENDMLKAQHSRLCSDGSSSQSWSMQSYTEDDSASQAPCDPSNAMERSFSMAHDLAWLAPHQQAHSLSGSSFNSADDLAIFSATPDPYQTDAPLFPQSPMASTFAGHGYFSTSHAPHFADQQYENMPLMSMWS